MKLQDLHNGKHTHKPMKTLRARSAAKHVAISDVTCVSAIIIVSYIVFNPLWMGSSAWLVDEYQQMSSPDLQHGDIRTKSRDARSKERRDVEKRAAEVEEVCVVINVILARLVVVRLDGKPVGMQV